MYLSKICGLFWAGLLDLVTEWRWAQRIVKAILTILSLQNEDNVLVRGRHTRELTRWRHRASFADIASKEYAMASAISTTDILFPESSANFSETLASLKRSTLSISNRLRSIWDDACFANEVSNAYGLPLVANERCGSWYINPQRKVESAYFKSTDGHTGQWDFSLRRLNTQILDVLGDYDG